MSYLKVLNVGQGDCMTIRPQCDCMFQKELFYVDLGNGQVDISKEIGREDKIHLILTHSHRDHINGISYIFPYFNQVEEIVLPYCFNEIWLIAKAIMNLRGMKDAIGCEDLKKDLIDIDTLQRVLINLLRNEGDREDPIKITFAYEGLSFCHHIHFLNPWLPDVPLNWLDDAQYSLAEEQIKGLFEEDFSNRLINYVQAQRRSYGVDHIFYRDFIIGDQTDETRNMGRAGCKLILNFIHKNFKSMDAFNRAPNKQQLNAILYKYNETAHDACLVMRLIKHEKSYLLSGDASKKVFYRLIKTNKMMLHADYFKIPHHGSDKNLDDKILREVDPQIAIISHGNAKFGRATDTHPNQHVLDLLNNRKICVLVTNDVIKKGVVKLYKRKYCNNDLEIE